MHDEEIAKDPQRISKLQHYKNQHNWNGLEFPLAIQNHIITHKLSLSYCWHNVALILSCKNG